MNSWEKVLDNLNDLIDIKNIKIEGMNCAIEILKKRQRKAIRELEYLRLRYETEEERAAVSKAIKIVKESYE